MKHATALLATITATNAAAFLPIERPEPPCIPANHPLCKNHDLFSIQSLTARGMEEEYDQAGMIEARDPSPRRGRAGGGAPPAGGGGSGLGQFGKDVASGVISGAIVAGGEAAISGLMQPSTAQVPAPVVKRAPEPDPRGARGGAGKGPAKPPAGGGSWMGQFAADVAAGTLSGAAGAGIGAVINGQTTPAAPAVPAAPRCPVGPPAGGNAPAGGPSAGRGAGGAFLQDVAAGTLSGAAVAGGGALLDNLIAPAAPPVPAPPVARRFVQNTISEPIGNPGMFEFIKEESPRQKRDPKFGSGRKKAGSPGGSTPKTAPKTNTASSPFRFGEMGKQVAADVASGVIVDGVGAVINNAMQPAQPAVLQPPPQKRDEVENDDVENDDVETDDDETDDDDNTLHAAEKQEFSQKPETKGRKVGKEIGAALANKALQSGASETLMRPGVLGYMAVGLMAALVVGGLNGAA
ncbi:hypothetical protein N0V88_004903 [Collariella sp. IMI 366227]|nr:hypothetical protein N0V88_004903 [Collariella sp. IMI 366227]